MNLKDAQVMAKTVRDVLVPLCLKVEIAGSIRRQKPDMIKDCEIVLVPDTSKLLELREVLNSRWGEPVMGKFPSKYVKIRGRYNLDIFICTAATFGLNYFIRTGPQSFVTGALKFWKQKTNGGYSEEAQLHLKDGTVVPTPSEEAVFEALGWKIVRAENRV